MVHMGSFDAKSPFVLSLGFGVRGNFKEISQIQNPCPAFDSEQTVLKGNLVTSVPKTGLYKEYECYRLNLKYFHSMFLTHLFLTHLRMPFLYNFWLKTKNVFLWIGVKYSRSQKKREKFNHRSDCKSDIILIQKTQFNVSI